MDTNFFNPQVEFTGNLQLNISKGVEKPDRIGYAP